MGFAGLLALSAGNSNSDSSDCNPRSTTAARHALGVMCVPPARLLISSAMRSSRDSTSWVTRPLIIGCGPVELLLRGIAAPTFLLPQPRPFAGCGVLVAAALAWVPHLPFAVSRGCFVSPKCHCSQPSSLSEWVAYESHPSDVSSTGDDQFCLQC